MTPDAADTLDAAALGAWLGERRPVVPPLRPELVAAGRSNLTYLLRDAAGGCWVLRRPPAGPRGGGAHDMGREYRILGALAGSGVPVPGTVAYEEDPALVGAPFFVMDYVGGATISDPAAAVALPDAARRDLGERVAAVLGRLHRLDPVALGLGDLIRAEGLLERQLRRWHGQIAKLPELTTPAIEEVHAALAERVPAAAREALVHGDFKLANMRVDERGEVLGVLDWELAAVGDPGVDVGWLLASWAEPDDGGAWSVPPPTTVPGFCSRAELATAIAAHSPVAPERLDYYVAFALWRWACINEGVVFRFSRDAMGGRRIDLEAVRRQIRWQLRTAADLLAGRAGILAGVGS